MEQGANIHHAGCHGGTALHWACWCGRSEVVEQLIARGAAINQRCIDFKASPLFWAIHGLKNGGSKGLNDSLECVKLLIQSGADKNIPNVDGDTVYDMLSDEDESLKELLKV
jgi:ankyrin repeat protein